MVRNLYTLIITVGLILCAVIGILLIRTKKAVNVGRVLVTVIMSFITVFAGFIALVIVGFSTNSRFVDFYAVLILIAMAIIIISTIGGLWGFIRKKKFYIPVLAIAVAGVISVIGLEAYDGYIESIPKVAESEALLWEYAPYEEGTKVAELEAEATLKLTENLPILDGATALYPIYSAFAKAVYPMESILKTGSSEILNCNRTNIAYEKIVTGEADIIFVAGPSEEQKKFAEEKGVELVYTPIGKEGFVFFVNANNPLGNVTIDEIQGIYSGEITKWNELGINGLGNIKAFQRPEGSGSQSALQRLMADIPIMTAPTEDVVGGMGGIIEKTADYRNFKNAIGYSFRFYSTEMVKNNQIRLLKINDVKPIEENIRNGSYPISSNFYAVTRSDASENTKKLIEWILSEQGQELIEKTGYTPIN